MEPDRSHKAQVKLVAARPFEFVVRRRVASVEHLRAPITKGQHVAVGIALIGIGLTLAYWLPLPHGLGIVPTLMRYGISIGEALTFIGAVIIVAASS